MTEASSNLFQNHERKIPLSKCFICDKEFDKFGLEKHYFEFHNDEITEESKSEILLDKQISCKEDKLKLHINRVHESKKDCASCGKRFSTIKSLKLHIHTVHEGHKDHKCESCGKSFSQKAHLKKHIHTIHEGHKDYNCESCGKLFSSAGNLKRHTHVQEI